MAILETPFNEAGWPAPTVEYGKCSKLREQNLLFETDQLWTRDNQGRNGYCVFVCPTTFLGTGGCDYGPTVRLVKGDIVET